MRRRAPLSLEQAAARLARGDAKFRAVCRRAWTEPTTKSAELRALGGLLEQRARSPGSVAQLGTELDGAEGELTMFWAQCVAERRDLALSALLAQAAARTVPPAGLEDAARAVVLSGSARDALACVHLTGARTWVEKTARGAVQARVELALWHAGATAASVPELADWLLADGWIHSAARGSLRQRALAARALAVAADGIGQRVVEPSQGELLTRAVLDLLAHPEPLVWIGAAHALGRLAGKLRPARIALVRRVSSAHSSTKRRAHTALAALPAEDRPMLDLYLGAAIEERKDPWLLASVGPSILYLASQHRDTWQKVLRWAQGTAAGAEVSWSLAQGLSAAQRAGVLDRDLLSLATAIRQRASRTKTTSAMESLLWRDIQRSTDFVDAIGVGPDDPAGYLELLVDRALEAGPEASARNVLQVVRALPESFESALREATASTDPKARVGALLALESASRASAVALWQPLLAAAAESGQELVRRAARAEARMLELAVSALNVQKPSFVLHRSVLRALGHRIDSTPRPALSPIGSERGRVTATIAGALGATTWLSSARRRDRTTFAKPVSELLWRLADATRERRVADGSRHFYGPFAAWWTLTAGAKAEVLALLARSEAEARSDDSLLVDASASELSRALSAPEAMSGGWDEAVGACLRDLDAGDTNLARALSRLACAFKDATAARIVAAPLGPALDELAAARAELAAVLADPIVALSAETPIPARQPASSDLGPLLTPAYEHARAMAERRRSEAPPLVRRRRVGRYELIERLGGGFAGDVWLVADAETSRRFVMKTPAGVVHGKPGEKVEALLRALVAEADALKRLYHPRVATFVDYGVSGKMPYLVLEYLIGTDLAAYRDARKLTLQELNPIVLDVASGLSALHGAHLVHRDMKPGNVFLRLDLGDGERFDPRRHRDQKPLDAVVIDFGFVRPMTRHAVEPETFVAGTLGYLSPEQAWGRSDLDAKSDVYGLAATVYSALTCKAFFDELRPRERILAHRSAPPLESPERVRGLPASLVQLLRRSTALEPAERPTVAEFAEQFSTIG